MAAVVDAETLLQDCLKAGLEVSVDEGALVVWGPYVPELFEQLKKHKPAIVELLQRKRTAQVLNRTAPEVIRQWGQDHGWPELKLGPGRMVGPGEAQWQSLLRFLTLPTSSPTIRKQQLRLCQEVCMRIAQEASEVVWLAATAAALRAWGELNGWPPLRIPSNPPLVIQGKPQWDILWAALQSEQLSPCELAAVIPMLAQQAGLTSPPRR